MGNKQRLSPRRLLALAGLTGCLLLQALPGTVSVAAEKPAGEAIRPGEVVTGVQTAENQRLRLELDTATCWFTVENKETGRLWYSNPQGREEDNAKGKTKQELNTMLIVRYLDSKNLQDTAASYTYSVLRNAHEVRTIPGGFRITYTFDGMDFIIPVDLYLEGDAFRCGIVAAEIEETGQNRVLGVELLPYFGAGGAEDDGYLLIPDGSGALMRFGSNKGMYASYSEKVYGRDINLDLIRQIEAKQTISLPVFGIRNNGEGLLAVLSQPAAAIIKADPNGSKSSYASARAEFELRSYDTYMMGETMGSRVKLVDIHQEGDIAYDRLEIEYFFLNGEQADYTGMAGRYRQYLMARNTEAPKGSDKSPRLFIRMLGATRRQDSVMGIPTTVIQPVTSYDEASVLLEDLRSLGAEELAVLYGGWDKTSIQGKPVSKLSPEGKLGGRAALERLIGYAKEKGIPLYFDVEPQIIESWGNGYLSFTSSAKTISGNLALQYTYDTATYFKIKGDTAGLFAPSLLNRAGEGLVKNTRKFGLTGLSLGSLSRVVYSDFAEQGWTRQDSADALEKLTADLTEEGISLLAQGANAYVLPYATHLTDLPVSSSRFEAEDDTVPFLQLVLSGYRSFASGPVNLSDDAGAMLLQALETGGALQYYLADVEPGELTATYHSQLYGISYADHRDEIVRYYEILSQAAAVTESGSVVRHEILQADLYCSTFSNGAQIVVNYAETDAQALGHTVPARGYLLMKGGTAVGEGKA